MFETDIMISRRTKDDIKSDIENEKFIRSASTSDLIVAFATFNLTHVMKVLTEK